MEERQLSFFAKLQKCASYQYSRRGRTTATRSTWSPSTLSKVAPLTILLRDCMILRLSLPTSVFSIARKRCGYTVALGIGISLMSDIAKGSVLNSTSRLDWPTACHPDLSKV